MSDDEVKPTSKAIAYSQSFGGLELACVILEEGY